MNLTSFNSASDSAALEVLRPCVDITRWATEIIRARPFNSREELLSFAEQAAQPWT
jgi:2-oxo-4-hydroxy-4-carboxy-5-ureidoimidazoline decarboxylase